MLHHGPTKDCRVVTTKTLLTKAKFSLDKLTLIIKILQIININCFCLIKLLNIIKPNARSPLKINRMIELKQVYKTIIKALTCILNSRVLLLLLPLQQCLSSTTPTTKAFLMMKEKSQFKKRYQRWRVRDTPKLSHLMEKLRKAWLLRREIGFAIIART